MQQEVLVDGSAGGYQSIQAAVAESGSPEADDCAPTRKNLSVERALAAAQPKMEDGVQLSRDDILQNLSQQQRMQPSDARCFHGRFFAQSPPAVPAAVWVSKDKPRSDKHGDGAPDWLDATEVRTHAPTQCARCMSPL